jgi:dihydroflavonol-4-reductase
VEGSRNTLQAAAGAGVRRLVFTSSATTLGEAAGTTGTESSPHRGWFLSNYERSKFEAEQLMLSNASGVEVVVANPSSVQGPGRATGTGRLFLDLINGRIPAIVDSRVSIVDIDDCARGHVLAETDGRPGRRYVLSGFTLGTREAVRLLEEVTGLHFRLMTVPGGAAAAAALLLEMGSRATGRHPRFCREMVRVMRFGHTYDGSRAGRELGLQYTAAEETLRRTVRWFAEEGLVTRELPGPL